MSDVIDRDGFRHNVGIVLMHEGKVFLGRRTGGRGWQFPQGGMREGEAPEEAVFRELAEEIGVERASVELVGSTSGSIRISWPQASSRRNRSPVSSA